MTRFIANARMYAVASVTEEAWRGLIEHVTEDAGFPLAYLPYPAPQPLEHLWSRPDLGAVLMCGFPIATGLADVTPLAAPIPASPWAGGRAVYRSDLIVRRDAPFVALSDTFGGRAGWTVTHSHSGFNAFRHHLLRSRKAGETALYREMVGNLVTARRVLDAVIDGTIDIGPLDAYWHMLIAKYCPDLAAQIRILEATGLAPMPAFVAAPSLPMDAVAALRRAFAGAHLRPWFPAFANALLLEGFAPVSRESFAQTLAWDEEAKAAGYPFPA
jgi:ABC-type phosphate/phosphonate transport system substrate-binding protein